ncbi:MAG TPA: hypothetical protein VK674_06445 [Candidatus Limnocylindria bacterium]|nr:hypothetical protein [Candidatus Limnocylindria bacterium]
MVLTGKLRRPKALAAAILLIMASLIPIFSRRDAGAYGLILDRKITMSSSADGSLAVGQGVTYEVQFEVASDTENIAGMVVDFCEDSPIVGNTTACDPPGGFDTNIGATTLNQTGPLAGFSIDATNSTDNTFILTHGTSYNPGSGETLTFSFAGVDNPENTNTTFYARIITYNDAAAAQAYDSTGVGPSSTNPGDEADVIDVGGVALSTAEQITVTSKVQEQLDFCMYVALAGTYNSCSVTGNAVTLGDSNGVLSTLGPFVHRQTRYNVRTNAQSGVTIRMKGTTLTHPSAYTISATGAIPGATSAPGTEQFGLCTFRDTGGGNVGLSPVDGYDGDGNTSGVNTTACSATTHTAQTATTGGDNGATFAFDGSATAETGATSTYGAQIATKTAGDWSTGIIALMGNIAYTTEAGVYSTTLTFIATGTY